MLRLSVIIALLVLLSSPVTAITLPFPGGDITDEEDENGDPTGRKLFLSKLIKIPDDMQELEPNGSISIETFFKTNVLTIFDEGVDGNSSESWHLEVNGLQMKKLQYSYFFSHKKGEKTKLKRLSAETGVTPDAPHDTLSKDGLSELVSKTDLFGNPEDARRQIIGFKLVVRNDGTESMHVKSLRAGLDAQDVTYTEVPLPGSGALLAVVLGAGVLLRRGTAG